MKTKGQRQSKNVGGPEKAGIGFVDFMFNSPRWPYGGYAREQLNAFQKARALGIDKMIKAMPDAVKRDRDAIKKRNTKTSRKQK